MGRKTSPIPTVGHAGDEERRPTPANTDPRGLVAGRRFHATRARNDAGDGAANAPIRRSTGLARSIRSGPAPPGPPFKAPPSARRSGDARSTSTPTGAPKLGVPSAFQENFWARAERSAYPRLVND
jgi:hypothetical protein